MSTKSFRKEVGRVFSTLLPSFIALSFLAYALAPSVIPNSNATTVSSNAGTTGVMIPLYMYPNGNWTQAIQVKQANPTVPVAAVVNPGSGPGVAKDSTFATAIQQLQSAGITVLGYVDTGYGTVPTATVESNINAYMAWYRVNGIFFDDMMNVPGYETYYSTLSAYAHSAGATLTVGNPGATVPASYVGTMDTLVTYENSGLPGASLFSAVSAFPKSNWAVMPYGVAAPSSSYLSTASNYVGWVYITNGVMPDPYLRLPSYLATEASMLASSASAPPLQPTPSSSIGVNSLDLAGNPIIGLWTTIQSSSSGATVATGFTPLTYSATTGQTYQVCVSNYGNDVFSHWASGGTSSCTSVTASGSTTISAYYTTSVSITVKSVDLGGNAITGLWTTVQSSNTGATVATGFTPVSYAATAGQSYVVCVSNYGSDVFSHWSDGNTNACRTATATGSTALTAYYSTSTASTINVNSVDLNGNPIAGLWTTMQSNHATVATGFTPMSYTGTSGQAYLVCASSYGNYAFSHWGDGSTSACETVTAYGATSLTAYYST